MTAKRKTESERMRKVYTNILTDNLRQGLIAKEEFAKELRHLYEYQQEENEENG